MAEILASCKPKDLGERLPAATTDNPTVTSHPPTQDLSPADPTDIANPSTQSPPTATSTPLADLAVARNGSPDRLVRSAIDSVGGMSRFVPKGAWVIIKPNICTDYYGYEYAATTNPWVVGTLVQLAMEAGAEKVQVMDFPFGGSAESAYRNSGIAEQVAAAGGDMVLMSDFKYKKVAIKDAISLSKTNLYEDVQKADVLIDVPIAKTHGLAGLTLGMKNLMGLIRNREEIHWMIGDRLTDLTRLIKPTLTVIDGVRVLVANGPTGGSLDDVRQMDTVIVSPDVVAADSYAATALFGRNPEELTYIRSAVKANLGISDLSSLNIQEISLGG
jgi:uncharacterized protein (DUF362 family)